MLFSYSAKACEDNWLHDAVLAMILDGMELIDAGQPVLDWPECMPEPQRTLLSTRTGLRDCRTEFLDAYTGLAPAHRASVKTAVSRQNDIPSIFGGQAVCVRLSDLPVAIQKPAKKVFEFTFKLLTPLGLRDAHYKKIYDGLAHRLCPFCGIERLDAPSMPREDLDHYLPISVYPFAGANLHNLSPMGGRCNSAFKHTADVLFGPGGVRRRCSDPYSGPSFQISLKDSQPFEGKTVELIRCPEWVLDIDGDDAEAATTWDSVFRIKDRYVTSHLNPEFREWVSHFAKWCVRSGRSVTNNLEAVDALSSYIDLVIQEGLADSAFLKRAVFTMLRDHCEGGQHSERLKDWLIDLVANHFFVDAA